jgi:cytochrome P450
MSNWKQFGESVHRADAAIWTAFWEKMVFEVAKGVAPHSFGKGFVQSDFRSKGLDELQAAYVCGTMIEAGSDTTSTQLNNTIVGILSRGRVVIEKAQEELDRVVGRDRTPTFEDEPNLPYIRAMVKEVMRWRFVNKFGTNHYATEDGYYKGYFIPKGSIVMINIWGIHYDPKRFPEPEKVHRFVLLAKCSMTP